MMSTTGFCRGEVQWGRGVMSVHQGRRSRWQTDDLQDACCTCAEIMPASDRLYLVKRESCFRFALAFCSIVRTKSRRDIFQKMSIAEAPCCQGCKVSSIRFCGVVTSAIFSHSGCPQAEATSLQLVSRCFGVSCLRAQGYVRISIVGASSSQPQYQHMQEVRSTAGAGEPADCQARSVLASKRLMAGKRVGAIVSRLQQSVANGRQIGQGEASSKESAQRPAVWRAWEKVLMLGACRSQHADHIRPVCRSRRRCNSQTLQAWALVHAVHSTKSTWDDLARIPRSKPRACWRIALPVPCRDFHVCFACSVAQGQVANLPSRRILR